MARPRKPRFVSDDAPVSYFKPQGIPLVSLSEVILTLDGCEALRLVDVESLAEPHRLILRAIDGVRSLGEIAEATHNSDFPVARLVFDLIEHEGIFFIFDLDGAHGLRCGGLSGRRVSPARLAAPRRGGRRGGLRRGDPGA